MEKSQKVILLDRISSRELSTAAQDLMTTLNKLDNSETDILIISNIILYLHREIEDNVRFRVDVVSNNVDIDLNGSTFEITYHEDQEVLLSMFVFLYDALISVRPKMKTWLLQNQKENMTFIDEYFRDKRI